MGRVATWGPVVLTVAASGMLLGAEPAAPRPFPPLPVPPVEHRTMAPYFARITISGDARMTGVFEECVDTAGMAKTAHARAQARPADAPPLTGCTHAYEMQPGGSVHMDMRCDQAKGAMASFHRVSDGTPSDLRSHVELYGVDAVTKAPKTTVFDSHLVRLGACPADLQPGQMRRPGGPVLDKGDAARLREDAQGAAL